MLKKASHGKKDFGISELLISTAVFVGMIVILSFVFSLIAFRTENPIIKTDLYALFTLVGSAVAAGLICGRLFGTGKTMLASLLTVFIMLLFGIIISGGMVSGGAFMNYGCFILASLAGSYIGRKREKRSRKRHHRV